MKHDPQVSIHPLAQFAASLRWDDVPAAVQQRAEDLWVDWFGSVLAGQGARPVQSITRFALSQDRRRDLARSWAVPTPPRP